MTESEPNYRRPGQRPTNALLVKHIVGKAKPATYQLPPETYTYGVQKHQDEEGVREIVGQWKPHVSPPPPPAPRDFVRMNQLAPKDHCVTALAQTQFRKTNDLRVQPQHKPEDDKAALAARTFGKASRPSTPIAGVLSHAYGREYVSTHQRQKQQEEAKAKDVKHKTMVRSRQETNASKGHARAPPEEPKEPFKMQRFLSVESRIKLPKLSATAVAQAHGSDHSPSKTPEVFVPHGPPSGPYPGEKYTLVQPPATGAQVAAASH